MTLSKLFKQINKEEVNKLIIDTSDTIEEFSNMDKALEFYGNCDLRRVNVKDLENGLVKVWLI